MPKASSISSRCPSPCRSRPSTRRPKDDQPMKEVGGQKMWGGRFERGPDASLYEFERRAQTDPAWLDASQAEDVHHFAETALIEKLGPLGAKLHTGRSRNEMVATEFRMYIKDAAREMRGAIASLGRAFVAQAEKNIRVPMAGTTHMQHAQPLLLSHWLLAHAEAFLRDAERVASAAARADLCPMGSG